MRLNVFRLDSLELGACHRHPIGQFEFVRRSAGSHSSFELKTGNMALPSGAVLECQATYVAENRSLSILADLDGERVFAAAFECEWMPCAFEIRISRELAIGFYVVIETDDPALNP